LRFIRGSKFLIQLVIGLVVNFFGAGIFALLAPYAKNVIGGNAGTYGAILTTYSVGAVMGSVLVGKLQLRNYVGKMLFAGVIGQGFVIVGIGLTTVLSLALALSFAIGVLQTMVNVPMTVLVQTKVPGDMLASIQLSSGSSNDRCSGFVCSRRGSGNFYLNRRDIPSLWRIDRRSLCGRISVL
jgi:MFS family permease